MNERTAPKIEPSNLQQVAGRSRELIDWYWKHGCKRSGTYRIGGEWLYRAYNCLGRSAALIELSNPDARPNLAIWGPSQTGKSTLIGRLIDNKDKTDSALTWLSDQKITFTDAPIDRIWADPTARLDLPPSFNPYNGGGDGSAVVGRYYLSDGKDIPEKNYTVKFCLGTDHDILHTLALGYVTSCETGLDNNNTRFWDYESLSELLSSYAGGGITSADREATELMLSLVQTMEGLIEAQNPRFTNLQKDQLWRLRLREEVLSTPALLSDVKKAKDFIGTVLWDDSQMLATLFSDLRELRGRILNIAEGNPIYLSIKLAAYLVNMNLHSSIADPRVTTVKQELSNLKLRCHDGYSVMEPGEDGKPIFIKDNNSVAYNLGLLQACCWELAIPLNSAFYANEENSLSLLKTLSILDIPGITNEGGAAAEAKLKRDDLPTDERVFKRLVKTGKTFSIIGRYARELKIDAILLLVRSALPLAQPGLIADGLKSILQAVDPSFSYGNRDTLAVPISLNFTFFAKVLSDAYQRKGVYDFKNIEDRLSAIGSAVAPENAYSFVTNAPEFHPDGVLNQGMIANKDPFTKEFVQEAQPWINRRLRSDRERASLEHVWDEDGGRSFLLESQAGLIRPHQRAERILHHSDQIQSDLCQLLAEVGPDTKDDGTRAVAALTNIRTTVKSRLDQIDKLSAHNATKVLSQEEKATLTREVEQYCSWLKTLFSCNAEDLTSLIGRGRPAPGADLRAFLERALMRWSASESRRDALIGLCTPARDVPIVLEAMANTLRSEIDIMEKDAQYWFSGPKQLHLEEQEINALRYLAVDISNRIKGATRTSGSLSGEMLRNACENRFSEWRSDRTRANRDLILEPMLNLLDNIPERLKSVDRPSQLGDDEIEHLMSQMNSAFDNAAQTDDGHSASRDTAEFLMRDVDGRL
jgi:hypothetical protein